VSVGWWFLVQSFFPTLSPYFRIRDSFFGIQSLFHFRIRNDNMTRREASLGCLRCVLLFASLCFASPFCPPIYEALSGKERVRFGSLITNDAAHLVAVLRFVFIDRSFSHPPSIRFASPLASILWFDLILFETTRRNIDLINHFRMAEQALLARRRLRLPAEPTATTITPST